MIEQDTAAPVDLQVNEPGDQQATLQIESRCCFRYVASRDNRRDTAGLHKHCQVTVL